MEIKRMRDLREDHDKTQQEIAELLNMHSSTRRRIGPRRRSPSAPSTSTMPAAGSHSAGARKYCDAMQPSAKAAQKQKSGRVTARPSSRADSRC